MPRKFTTTLRHLLATVVSLECLLVACLWAVDFVICPRCGYENELSRHVCSHCLTPLPSVSLRSEETVPPDAKPAPGKYPITPEMVLAEISEAMSALAAGDPEVAALFFRNALAMDLLAEPSGSAERASQIMEGIRACQAARPSGQRTCPVCSGSGKRMLTASSLSGETIRREAAGMACPRCLGTGFVPGPGSLADQVYARGQGLRRFGERQRLRRYTPVGGAWVPTEVAESLTIRHVARLKTARAAPCESCAGFGRVECGGCSGTGWVSCPNCACENGRVQQTQGGQLGGTRIRRNVPCPECHGLSKVSCRRCTGAGSLVCAACQGSGERPLCKPCSGTGLGPCRPCSDTGTFKGRPCAACRGEAVSLCSACGGDGRQR